MFFRTTRDLIGRWVFKATVGGQREQACFVTVGVTKRVRNISIISYSTILNGGACPSSLLSNERTNRRLQHNSWIRYIIISLTRITLRSFYFKEFYLLIIVQSANAFLLRKIIIDILNLVVL